MNKANETLAMLVSDEEMLKDRALFVENLGWLLSQTREHIISCELINGHKSNERVRVTYRGGGTKDINVQLDSYMAIVKDVSKYA